MPFDPNTIIDSPVTALLMALIIIGMFITGVLVRGKLVDDILLRFDNITDAMEKRNEIDAARLEWERTHEERRRSRRPSGS